MDEKQFNQIVSKLDGLTKLLAFNIVKDKNVTEQIDILTKAGLKVKDIAEILDRTENQIYVTQSGLRKRMKGSSSTDAQQSSKSEDAPSV